MAAPFRWLLAIAAAVALVWLLRRARFRLLGPVPFYELVRSSRRGRFILTRFGYATILLLALWAVSLHYQDLPGTVFVAVPGPGGSITYYPSGVPTTIRASQAAALARFAEAFFSAFMVVQLLAVLLLTPAYTAGAIAEEKDRKRLEFLLATDLSNREVVLGKLFASLANLTLLLLTGLPILRLVQLLGGVDPTLLLAGFATTGLTMLSLAALSILNSVYAQKPRDAIVLTYLAIVAYLMLSLFSMVPLRYLSRPGAPPELAVVAVGIEAMNAGNVFLMLAELRDAWNAGEPLAEVVPELVSRYATFHGLLTLVCTGWAVAGMRTAAMRAPANVRRRPLFRLRHGLRPTPGRQPMLWKEVFAEPGLSFSWFGRAIVAVIVVVSFAPAVWIAVEFLMTDTTDLRGFFVSERLSHAINLWVRLVGTTVATLTLLGVAVRAASSVSGERDRQTIDSLLSTPLSPEAILGAKWVGSILSVRWAWAWLALIWGTAAVLGGLGAVSLPWLLLTWLAYAAFFAAVGLYYSITRPTTLRATLATLGMLALLCFAHWLPRFFWQARPSYTFHDEWWRWLLDFQAYGLTPPFALSWLSFHGDNVYDPLSGVGSFNDSDPWNVLTAIIAGLLLWGVAAVWLWRRNREHFRESIHRMPWRLEKAYDYPGQLEAGPAPQALRVGGA